jgi:PAS domain S-box-containing protein
MQQDKTRILLVEDEEAHADLIRRAFESLGGMELTVAATLEEARGCLGKFSPDLVVADLMLPDGKGTELISSNENESHIPVVVMTSFGNETAAVEAMKAGALDYVVKSATTLADIPHVVERALREWRQVLARRQADIQWRKEREWMERALREAYRELEKKVEERTAELRDSEAKFRTLFESSNDAVMLLDEKGFFDCNDATLGIFGCSTREEFIGRHPSELSPLTQSNGANSLTAAKANIALAAKTGAAHFEWLHRRIDGTEFEADVLLSSMDLKGRTVLQAVVRDISERKRAEEAVLREQATLRRLLESSDRDRKLMAYEIHDGFAQHIAGAKMQLEAASQLKDENPEEAARTYGRGLELLTRSIDEARRLISGLRPPILDEAGVVAAIEHLIRDRTMQEGPEVGFVRNVEFGRLEPLLENAIFRIVQESVTNACRYSESSKVQIRLTRKNGQIHIEIEDWGIGFDPNNIAETSFGIGGIRERARLLGGQATIDSAPGEGTRIIVDLPLVCIS